MPKYVITVCNGTPCHFKNAEKILNCIWSELGLSKDKTTTDDGIFTVYESRYCLGACGVGPVIKVNETFYPFQNETDVRKLIRKLRFGE